VTKEIDTLLRIDELFLDKSTPSNAYRLETFRSLGLVSSTASQQLRCYFVTKCNFSNLSVSDTFTDGKTNIRAVSDKVFLEKATENTLEIYQDIMWSVESRYGPVIEMFEVEGTRERRVVIGFKMNSTSHFFRYVTP
jgi:glutamate dehydrogenase